MLPHPLPTIRIPVLPGDGDISINLQLVSERTYEAGPYSRKIDYQRDQIAPALTEQQATAVRQSLGN